MKKENFKIVVSLILFIIALLCSFSEEWVNNVIFIISYLIVGGEIVLKAIKNLFKGKVFDEHFLMSIATIGAFAIGEFPEAVAVMLFYQIGEAFQDYAVDKSKKSIRSLMDIRPDFANVNRNENIQKVNPEDVKIGEKIIIKPGEKIPLDGMVVDGDSMVDTMAITGEPVPKKVHIGDEVLSGYINQEGLLTVITTKEFAESTVNKILDLVGNASNKKSKSENFISKFAKYYTPIVVVMALILAIVPPFILKIGSFNEWLYRALTFLVVSCPCALVVSIPLGFFGGIGGASRVGILIKGSNYLETLANTEVVVFDKTGTLTKGVFEVQKVNAINISKDELIKLVAHAENFSNHPISISLKKAYGKDIDINLIKKTEQISGRGIEAIVDGKNVLIGNSKLMEEKGIGYEECNEIGTISYVAINNQYAGYILIADKIKDDSAKAINELKSDQIKQIIMLTGDRKLVGENVAKELKIGKVYTELLPDGKVEKLNELIKQKSEKGKVIFVGDGINDAPSLALADIGIAMGGLGSDAAIEAADVVIMTDEPSKISTAIKISKKTLKIVKQNIYFAIAVKIAVLILSAFGLSTMWEAVFADVGVSVLAILNSLRTLSKI